MWPNWPWAFIEVMFIERTDEMHMVPETSMVVANVGSNSTFPLPS